MAAKKNKMTSVGEEDVPRSDDGREKDAAMMAADNETGPDKVEAEEESEEEKLRREVADLNDKLLRMAADFENRGKRLEREKRQALEYAEESLLKEILPFIDNLERALAQDTANDDALPLLIEGVSMTIEGLVAALGKKGLKALESKGQPFDPNLHEAMAMQPGGDAPSQTVIEEYEKGYMFKERLLRAAKVVVAS